MTIKVIEELPENAIESSSSFYSIEPGHLIHIINKPKAFMTKEDATENILLLREISNGIPHLLLIDVTHIKSIGRDAREVYASEGNMERVKAVALLTRSTVGKIVGNFFIGFNKPTVPTKLFTDELAARKWLAEL